MGRHKKEISETEMQEIGQMALDGCQNGTIESVMGWPDNFIRERKDISAFLLQKRGERKRNLYHAQTESAVMAKNAVMQIWLGKNELGQTDKSETKLSGVVGTREISGDELRSLLTETSIEAKDAIAG